MNIAAVVRDHVVTWPEAVAGMVIFGLLVTMVVLITWLDR